LCDLHGVSKAAFIRNFGLTLLKVAFRPYLSQQFSICYDLYLSI
jgi:hypothetical protein